MSTQQNYLIRDIIFPPRCPFCEKIVAKTGRSCEACKEKLPYLYEPRCRKCSKPIFQAESEYCYDCEHKIFSYHSGKAVWKYEKEVAASISRFKFHDKQEYASFYAHEMVRLYGDWIRMNSIEAFLPVPIHKAKKRKRGYNQALLLAKSMGEEMNIPVLTDGITRVKNTKPQKELNDRERKKNLKAAFLENEEVLNGFRKVALIDDIYTTGATIEACTKVLLNTQITEVYFLCVSIGTSM
ncbi:MAG: ComF family protein [Acetivibrio sp.]